MSFASVFKKLDDLMFVPKAKPWVRMTSDGVTRSGSRRHADASKSFLESREHWWVFDWDNRVKASVAHDNVFTDSHFIMYAKNREEGTPGMVFRKQVIPVNPMAPARLRGNVHLLTPDQIRELDEVHQNQVQSIRTRTRLVFPDYVKEITDLKLKSGRPDRMIRPEPTVMHAWMYFNRSTPAVIENLSFDWEMFRHRIDAEFRPVSTERHVKEHIKNYFIPSHGRARKPQIMFRALDMQRLGREIRHEERLAEDRQNDKKKNEVYVIASPVSELH